MRNADDILKRRVLAFAFVALSVLGTLFKEHWGIEGGFLLDGLLLACLALGLWLWVESKRMERRSRRDEEGSVEEEGNEEEVVKDE